MREAVAREYVGVARVAGPLIFVEAARDVSFDETVEVVTPSGERRRGRVLEVRGDRVVVEVFQGTAGLSRVGTRVRFLGHPLVVPVSLEMLGRVFDAFGSPLDGGPEPIADEWRQVGGSPINPTARVYPSEFIQTGISALDGMNTLLRGQKLPIFSGSGLPHDEIAAQIARQARILGIAEEFSVVFAAMGVSHDVATFFQTSFEASGALYNAVLFLSLADAPPMERIVTPRTALTMAEYLAFRHNRHVLVILTNMTDYAAALREVASVREEVPGRKGYPVYLYSDLASIYERTGRIEGSRGSITQVPILTMPNDDITDPVPDLTGYITEGQIVLSRDLNQRSIYPPINVLPSLSRLMKDGIGAGKTRSDHPNLANQLYAAYAHVQDVRALASIIGSEELSKVDKSYLNFGNEFERRFVGQATNEDRSIEDTLELGWGILSLLPESELQRVSREELQRHYRGDATATRR